MAGIYIHIPFCKRKCHYCNFYSLASARYFDEVIEAIGQELVLRKNFLKEETVSSIYFGGGTPSMMDENHLEQLFQTINKHFKVSKKAEITLEANPDDLSDEKLKILKRQPVNRLSIGVQSFHDPELMYLNRVHTAQQAIGSIGRAREVGFDNLTIDLIYGLPGSTPASWKRNLELVARMEVPHLSCYALTVEDGTALAHFIRKGKMKDPPEEKYLNQFELLMDFAQRAGYEHYEISNFCTDKKYAVHNTSYWFGAPYLGVGPSAHSFDGTQRAWNVAHLKKYIQGIKERKPVLESEVLNEQQRYNEFVMTRLRTMWGVNRTDVEKQFSAPYHKAFARALERYSGSGLLLIDDKEQVRLSRKGIMVSDAIIADFFSDE